MVLSARRFLPIAFLLLAPAFACSHAQPEAEGSDDALSEPGAGDLPWEVRSRKGETYLPNVFYAEAEETQQIMPLTIKGRHQIDRLIYPTIGNPNLYVRSDKDDEFMMILRVEGTLLDSVGAKDGEKLASSNLHRLEIPADGASGLRFFAVSRDARASGESKDMITADGKSIFEIKPSALLAHSDGNLPEAFKARTTVRAVFDQAAMKDVPKGLYDVRMEVRKDGKIAAGSNGGAYEFQYNALRVFDEPYGEDGAHSIINVTDTQVSHSAPGRGPVPTTSFEVKTLAKLKEFVKQVNTSDDEAVSNAAFITFNGDLHNGGSPEALRPSRVAWTYNDEANAILETIKELNFPIFLTIGNHDGYMGTGQVPEAVNSILGNAIDAITGSEDGSLKKTVDAAEPKEWPNFNWDAYAAFLKETKADAQGGRHVDVFSGGFRRMRGAQTFKDGWIPVDAKKRNYVLYDGMHQWQRTYGPTYFSWSFGRNRYVNLNSFELRQHRRSGWGMYTVNYGGGLSQVQAEWLEKELTRAEKESDDVTLLAHHDPRGGHNGKDYPYYFKQIDYRGMSDSATNYIKGEIVNPKICEWAPKWAQTHNQQLSCLHDGLEEWMRPDTEFDCDEEDRLKGDPDGRCDTKRFSTVKDSHPWYSGYVVLAKLHAHTSVRTMILGHTHYNSIEMYQSGSPLVPGQVVLDAESLSAKEAENPLRAMGMGLTSADAADSAGRQGIIKEGKDLIVDLNAAGHSVFGADRNKLKGKNRELAILRLTSNSDLSTQTYKGQSMFGFSALKLSKKKDGRAYGLPQINAVRFFMNNGGTFSVVEEVPLDRTTTVQNAQVNAKNPLCSLFKGAGAEACP